MSYRILTHEQKEKLVEKLNWDYDVSDAEIVDVIDGKANSAGSFTRENLFARSLETL